ncbi:MAG: hypothetical protein RLZZ175_2675 [Bacteroidota bacterium]|jgi:hypothetical protein
MKRIIFVSFLIFKLIHSSFSIDLLPFSYGEKWGYFSIKSKKIIVNPIYGYAFPFEGNFALVKIDGLFNIQDTLGNLLLNNNAKTIYTEDNKKFTIILNEQYMLFDAENRKVLIDFNKYEKLGHYNEGLISFSKNGKWGYLSVNKDIKEVVPAIYKNAYRFKYGKACVSLNSKYGLISTNGNVLLDFKYKGLIFFDAYNLVKYEAKLIVDKKIGIFYDSKSGLIDTNLNLIVDTIYSHIAESNQNHIVAQVNHLGEEALCGLVEKKTGRVIIPFKYKTIFLLKNSSYVAVNLGEKWGLVNIKKTIKEKSDSLIYDYVSQFWDNGVGEVHINNKKYLVNTKGEKVVNIGFEDIKTLEYGNQIFFECLEQGNFDECIDKSIGSKVSYYTINGEKIW